VLRDPIRRRLGHLWNWAAAFPTSERLVRAFNVAMALLLLASLYPVFTDA